MVSFDHKKIIDDILNFRTPPSDMAAYKEWLSGRNQIDFLNRELSRDEITIFGSTKHFYLESAVIAADLVESTDIKELLCWNGGVFDSCASYVTGGGKIGAWIERNGRISGSDALETARPLVYGRQFEGLSGPESAYFEVLQEYSHLNAIHWRPEQRAYCKFDDNGDFLPIVSITSRKNSADDISLTTFRREQLDNYLAADQSVLVRMFDFTCLRYEEFQSWSNDPEEIITISKELAFRRKIDDEKSSYLRGVQILRPSIGVENLSNRVFGFPDTEKQQYVSFMAHDFRNQVVSEISTDPKATTNYFQAAGNDLPFELSPAFFRRDVLSKYRQDREKYGVGDRDITCRGAWSLKGFDMNEAGQVHAYICDLRRLPYQEQLYWKSFNEPPKSGISDRAVASDFKGEWSTESNPLRDITTILGKWEKSRAEWWQLTDTRMIENIAVPHSGSKDEWAESFMDLSKLIVEGFNVKFLRNWLKQHSIEYENSEQSIALLERIRTARNKDDVSRFEGLRTVQFIRSKVKGHSGSSKAQEIESAAITEHETFAAHFQYICSNVYEELKEVGTLF